MTSTKKKMFWRAALMSVAFVIVSSAPAFAAHAHYVVMTDKDGNTTCQYIAAGRADPSSGEQIHNRVHTGPAGTDANGNDFDRDSNEASRCDEVRQPDPQNP